VCSSDLEKKVDKKEAQPKTSAADQKHLQNALARVTQKVQSGAYGLGGGGGGGGGQGDNRFAYYYTQIWQKVRSNWILPEEWQQKKLEAILIISVMPNGAIASIKFEKRSGSPAFDQSVMWAVERSNPLPPFPQGMSLEKQEIGIRFNPEG
jgi:colicin import membrane protein